VSTHLPFPNRLLLLAALALMPAATGWAARSMIVNSDHFTIGYDPARLTEADVRRAMAEAVRGYEHCLKVFGRGPSGRIACDLTPRFLGATGFASPDARRPRIGVRYADLEYLGLAGQYVLTHEIAHIFSGQDASGPLGEGLADFVAGTFNEIPLAPWWGRVLRERRLWTDADGLFVTGDYPAANELDARVRISQYAEPALLLQYLAQRFGMNRVEAFLPAYSRVRYSLASNEALSERPAGPPSGRSRRPRRPDAEKVRAVFQEQFGATWESVRDGWLAAMDGAAVPAGSAEQLVLAQEIYGAIRGYESWLVQKRLSIDDPRATAIRAAFTRANQALRKQDTALASEELWRARGLVDRWRHPAIMADKKFVYPFETPAGLYSWGL
jgi:hypothetical protein